MSTETKAYPPMAGVAETMAALDLSDEQWDTTPRAVGHKLRAHVNSHAELLAALKECADLLANSEVRFKICDGGCGNLGEHSLYHRVFNAAQSAIRKAQS